MKILFLMMALVLTSISIPAIGSVDYNPVVSESQSLTFKKSGHSFIVSWVEGPKRGISKFILKSWNHETGTMNGPYQNLPKNLFVFLWMPTMGHGSAPVTITQINEGEYQVSNVKFTMGGKWEIKFQLKDGSQVVDEAVITLNL